MQVAQTSWARLYGMALSILTLAVTSREAGARYAVIMFAYMTTLAWLGAVITFQVVSRLPL